MRTLVRAAVILVAAAAVFCACEWVYWQWRDWRWARRTKRIRKRARARLLA